MEQSELNRVFSAPLARRLETLLLWSSIALISYALYLIFLGTPNERMMGPVQKILYFHAGSATACYLSVGILFLGSIAYLATRDRGWDALAAAGGEVGFMLSTIVLGTGMIWGHSAWNTWFRFEPRLVTFLLLWLLFLGYSLLRTFGDQNRIASHSAVLGILCSLTAPLVWYSIQLLPQVVQLHPQVVGRGGLAPEFKPAFFISMGALLLFTLYVISFRTRIGLAENAAHAQSGEG